MPGLLPLENLILPPAPELDILVHDLHIDIEPSEIFLLPKIHIDTDLDIFFKF